MKRKQPKFPPELIKQLLSHAKVNDMDDLTKVAGELQKTAAEVILNAEMDEYLENDQGSGNHRNGYSAKTVHTDSSKFDLSIPRDRQARFEPQLVEKRCRRIPGFDRKVIALYARGMSTRDIQGHIEEIYGFGISPALVSRITEEISAEVTAWQSRPLEGSYPIVFFDAVRVKVRHDGQVKNMALYVALAIDSGGRKQLLGLWLHPSEGAKIWQQIFADLAARGLTRILIAVVDNLSGMAEAVEAVFPDTVVQSCIVHQLRNSLKYVPYGDRKQVADALKAIYRAANEKAAAAALEEFANSPFGAKYPPIVKSWRANWEQIIPFFAFSPEVRFVDIHHQCDRERQLGHPQGGAQSRPLPFLGLGAGDGRDLAQPVQQWAPPFRDRRPPAGSVCQRLAPRLGGAGLRIGTMVRAVRQNPASAMAARIPVYNVPTLGVWSGCIIAVVRIWETGQIYQTSMKKKTWRKKEEGDF